MTGIYDTLWNDAISAFERGEPQIDPHLSDKTKDPRRGVTLVFRPSPDVREAITAFIGRSCHCLSPANIFTSLKNFTSRCFQSFPALEHWRRDIGRVAASRRVIADVLKAAPPFFKIDFHGITASPGTVMIQGFPAG